jgi:hypothetical protein
VANLTDDELTVLTLAAAGESIAAIGRWEEPCDRLVSLGLLSRGDKFNNFITAAGRAAVEAAEAGEDEAFARALGRAQAESIPEGRWERQSKPALGKRRGPTIEGEVVDG